jgi:aryl-alcohol dehydrogenase-like predicted oxidoreductase
MKYKKFGNTGMLVSELCLGAMTFGGRGFWTSIGQLKQEAVNDLVGRSLEAGINFFDTANVYSEGESEKLLGQSFKDLQINRDSIIIATKVSGGMGKGPNDSGLSRHHIFNQVKASLERLQTDYIDVYQIHGFDPLTPFEETLVALNDIVRSGLVRYIGCSNLMAWQVMKSLGISSQLNLARFESVQAYYTIAGRDLEREMVPMMQDQNLGLMVWSPLAGGLLSGKFKKGTTGPDGARRTNYDFPPVNLERAYPIIDLMEQIAKKNNVSVARVALAWILSKTFVTTIIIGAKNLDQLNDNIESVNLKLSAEDLTRLDEASNLPPEYPGWMLAFRAKMGRNEFLKKL